VQLPQLLTATQSEQAGATRRKRVAAGLANVGVRLYVHLSNASSLKPSSLKGCQRKHDSDCDCH